MRPQLRVNRAILVLLFSAAATLGWVGLSPVAAEAAPAGCSATYFCFYADPGYSGGMGKVAGDNSDYRVFSTSTHNCGNGNWDNCISSVFNNGTQCTVWMYKDVGYNGTLHTLNRGAGITDLKSIGFDDVISANSWCGER